MQDINEVKNTEQPKWHRRKGVRIVALVTAVTLIGGELGRTYLIHASEPIPYETVKPELNDAQKAFMENPQESMAVIDEVLRLQAEQEEEQQEFYDLVLSASDLLEQEKYEEALEKVDLILEHPQITREYTLEMEKVKLALTIYLGKAEETISLCDKILATGPEDKGYYHYLRGMSYVQLEKYEQAYLDFEEAHDQGIDDTLFYFNRAVSELGTDRVEEAKKDLELVISRNDDSSLTESAKELIALL